MSEITMPKIGVENQYDSAKVEMVGIPMFMWVFTPVLYLISHKGLLHQY